MKRLLLFLLCVGAFFSCQKQKFCWKCVIITTVYTSPADSNTQTVETCDKSQADIDAYEKAGSMNTTSGGIRISTSVTCEKEQ